jgi:prepilin signal peptidase PulO-like enzyme (type II secretory pathway)
MELWSVIRNFVLSALTSEGAFFAFALLLCFFLLGILIRNNRMPQLSREQAFASIIVFFVIIVFVASLNFLKISDSDRENRIPYPSAVDMAPPDRAINYGISMGGNASIENSKVNITRSEPGGNSDAH